MKNIAWRGAGLFLVAALGVTGAAPPAAAAPAVRGRLLPIPAGLLNVTVADVSPLGVVAGTSRVTTTGPDGNTSLTETPYRWLKVPRAGWLRQSLALPAGATSGAVTGLTDRGEAAGNVTLDGVSRAVRWSVDGRTVTLIGAARSRTGAVGPNGPWGVSTSGTDLLSGESELVTRAGVRTPLRGTPELDAGYRRNVGSVGGPDLALVWVINGIGRGITGRPVIWQGGATVQLPVFSSVFLTAACVTPLRPDGSIVASGFTVDNGVPSSVLVRHVGGVPGTTVELNRASQSGQPNAGLTCRPDQTSNTLARDGGIAGYLTDAQGRQAAAHWNAANEVTTVPLAPGERSATGVAAATGGRMVIQSEHEDGTSTLSLWHNGTRTPLPAPAGWTVSAVTELTDAGLLVANVRNAAGAVRPAAWTLPAVR